MMWRTDTAKRRDEALLVALAEQLCADAAAIEPRAEFRSSLRSTLLAEAPPATSGATLTHPVPARRRRMAIATGVVAASLGLAGMVTASASAMPGEALYPVKRTAERVELVIHRTPADRGAFHLELADRRLDEATQLFDRGPAYTDLGIDALEEFDHEAEEGSAALVEAYQSDNSRDSIAVLNRFSAQAMRQLSALQSKLVGVSLPQVDETRGRLAAIAELTARLCPDCGGNPLDARAATAPSQATTQPQPVRSTAVSPSASASVADAIKPSRTTKSDRKRDDKNDDTTPGPDGSGAGSKAPLEPVVDPPALDSVPDAPALRLPPDTPADTLIDDLVDGDDDGEVDLPDLQGEDDLLDLDSD